MNTPPLSEYEAMIERALAEDIGKGDVTTRSLNLDGARCEGRITAREDGVVAGLFVAGQVFGKVDPSLEFETLVEEGALVRGGTVLAVVRGNAEPVLAAERVALNFLQRLSGIASFTYLLVRSVKGSKSVIKDTRKTTPGLRALEKYAVRAGGGENHRYCLDDAVLLKDNHIDMVGGVAGAVRRARDLVGDSMTVEVETRNMDEVREAIEAGADVIMLDNMRMNEVEEAVSLIDGRALVEVSGNVSLINANIYAGMGVDIISVGALTHSPDAMDIGMDFIPLED